MKTFRKSSFIILQKLKILLIFAKILKSQNLSSFFFGSKFENWPIFNDFLTNSENINHPKIIKMHIFGSEFEILPILVKTFLKILIEFCRNFEKFENWSPGISRIGQNLKTWLIWRVDFFYQIRIAFWRLFEFINFSNKWEISRITDYNQVVFNYWTPRSPQVTSDAFFIRCDFDRCLFA